MSAYEKTAKEHVVLSGLESYIEDTIEYSDTILSIHNDIADVKQKSEADFEEATSYINRVRDLINRDVEREIYSLQNDIDDVKQTQEDNYSYAMEHINDEYDRLNADIQSDISCTLGRLEEEIENLKQMIKELEK